MTTLPVKTGVQGLAMMMLVSLAACGGGTDNSVAPAMDEKAALGRFIFFDASLSEPGGQSCASSHGPERAFPDLYGGFTSEGAVAGHFGTRNAPTVAYAAFSPVFTYDASEGTYLGGQFLDGRAASLVDQAQEPPLNPIEMHNASAAACAARVAATGKPAD